MAATVIVNGACGRMGKLLVKLVHEDSELELVSALESPSHPDVGKDVGKLVGIGEIGIKVSSDIPPQADILIDFSAPEATVKRAKECAENNTAILVGTTGLSPQQKAEVEALSSKVPVLISPNMSVGVNVLLDLVERTASVLGAEFDIEIVETHHRMKKDSPSGTARRLLEFAATGRGWNPNEVAVYGREGLVGARPDKQIGVMALRGGDVVGDHTVMFLGMGERIELTHRAQSREVFARGAIRVAKFLIGKPPGLYTMKDALGL